MGKNPKNKITQPISTELITLGQLVKLLSLIGSGSEVKDYLAKTTIRVNGELENRRGKKLYPGDEVEFQGGPFVTLVSG